MYDVAAKWLSGIKGMYVDSLACVKVKGGENAWFRIDSGVRQRCIMSPWLFNLYGCSDERGENGDRKEGIKIPGGGERVITWPLVCR